MPYNNVMLNCTVQAYVEGQTVPLAITVTWQLDHPEISETNEIIPSSDFMVSGSPDVGYQSTLSVIVSKSVTSIYSCRSVLSVSGVIEEYGRSEVTVVGKHGFYMFLCVYIY